MYRPSNQPLTDDQIRHLAPSVFADAPHTSRSERYLFIKTADVLSALRRENFVPVRAAQNRTRIDDRRAFTRHMLVFRQASAAPLANVGDLVPEIVLVNSHDGTSSYQLHAGLFRLVCSNGLIVADGTVATIKVQHTGRVVDNIIDATYQVVEHAPHALEQITAWRDTQLATEQQLAYARAALQLRYDDEHPAPITPAQLIQPRRRADESADLWTTYNVVQEKMITGGVRGQTPTGQRTRTRAVTSVTENVRLNKALWTLTEEMARLRTN